MPVKGGPINMQEAPKDNDTRSGERRPGDVEKDALTGHKRREAAWLTTLPPGIRKSMKSREKQSLPAGYEERLRKYFESLD
jgi:hypothetical protein